MLLAQLADSIDDAAAHEAEIAGILRQPHAARVTHQPVERVRGEPFQRGLPCGRGGGRRPCRTLAAMRRRGGMTSGGSCKSASIRIVASPRVIEAGGRRDFLPEVSRQRHQRDARIVVAQPLDHRARLVGAAVVDINRLPRAERLHGHGQRRWNSARPSASLKAGMTTESSGESPRLKMRRQKVQHFSFR